MEEVQKATEEEMRTQSAFSNEILLYLAVCGVDIANYENTEFDLLFGLMKELIQEIEKRGTKWAPDDDFISMCSRKSNYHKNLRDPIKDLDLL